MKLKKFIDILNESKLSNTVFQDLEAYFRNSIGNSVVTLGLTATDIQQNCRDLDIETEEEFLAEYPFPNQRIKGYAQEFFAEGNSDDLYYGEDEEDFWDYKEDDVELDDDLLSGIAAMTHKMIEDAGFKNFYVSNKKDNISIQFVLNATEKFSKMMKVLGIIKKIKTDILIQYDSEMDLWETKNGLPLLTFDFYYEPNTEGKYKKDEIPF
jgi:hypothetical protein